MTALNALVGLRGSEDAGPELQRARAQIAALAELLEVHELTSLDQATRLERSLAERDELLERERSVSRRLAESESRLRLALEAGRMATWEWDIVSDQVIWSPEEERLHGVGEGTFAGTIEEYRERIHPDDRERSIALVQDAIRERAPRHHSIHRIVRPGGEIRWIESQGRFVYAPDGTPIRLVGVSTDISERRAIEAARDQALAEARAERARLYEVFMQAPAAICVLEGPAHTFVVANPRYAQLVGGREVLGKSVREALPELEGQGLFDQLDWVYRTGESYSAREMPVLIDRDGDGRPEEVFVDFVYQALRDGRGDVYGILAHAVDVTEQVNARRQLEERAAQLSRLSRDLERSNAELDQFAYVASHDLKAPLRGIANLTQWIEEDVGERLGGESREHMRLLKARVHRMESLIDGILSYSRAGRAHDKADVIDTGALVADVIELLSPGPSVTVTIAPDMPVLETERVPLQQVFMNLIGNAIKYNDAAAPRIEIRTADEGEFVRFSIADNGPGIAPQFHERIWQIFQTLAPRDQVEGTGIGLSVVRKLVDTRGGRAWVESDVGRGTVFHFTWPKRTKR